MRTGVLAGCLIVIVAVSLFGALEAIVTPVSCTTQGTALATRSSSTASTVTTTTSVAIQRVITQTQRVYNINPNSIHLSEHVPAQYVFQNIVIIGAYRYIYQTVALTKGMDVHVEWSANNTLDVYVFNTSQNSAFAGSNATATSPNVASSLDSFAGSLSFRVPANDTYYLIFFNPRNGSLAMGSQPVRIYNGTGTATFQVTTATTVTQTTSYVVFVPQLGTSTQTTTGSYQRAVNLLSQIAGTACST